MNYFNLMKKQLPHAYQWLTMVRREKQCMNTPDDKVSLHSHWLYKIRVTITRVQIKRSCSEVTVYCNVPKIKLITIINLLPCCIENSIPSLVKCISTTLDSNQFLNIYTYHREVRGRVYIVADNYDTKFCFL